MTMNQCIALADKILPNGVTAEVKLRWLAELEGRVRVELLGEAPGTVAPPSVVEAETEQMRAPYPFDRMYWMYLVCMVEEMRGDSGRYEMAAGLFNGAYQAYGKWLRREGV